jgi:hypothetical protein
MFSYTFFKSLTRDLLEKSSLRSPQYATPEGFKIQFSISVPYKGEKDFSLIKVCYFLRMVGLKHSVFTKTVGGRKRQKVLTFMINLLKSSALEFFNKLIFIHSQAIKRRDGVYQFQFAFPRTLVFVSANLFDFSFYPKRYDFFGWKQPVFITTSTPYLNTALFSLYKVFPDYYRIKSKIKRRLR